MVGNATGLSPNNPKAYVGPNVYLSTVVNRTRRPTGADYRQPETGKLYPISSYWLVGKNPTTGVEGELWYLSKIVANVAYWLMLSGSTGPLLNIVVPLGVSPIQPDNTGTVNFTSSLGTIAITGSSANPNNHTINFDLTGGGLGIDSVALQTGTTPIGPDGTGQIIFNGSSVAAGTNPVRTNGTGPNTMQLEVQISQAIAATNATNIGLAAFNSAHFSVDANGFVSSIAGGFPWNDVAGAFAASVQNGYFITGTATGTLPASPVQGDTVQFFVDHATEVLTIQASGTQIIRMGILASTGGGTATSTQHGDSVELVYRAVSDCWCAVDFMGTWVMA